jgi:hypothetical protein
MRSAAAFRVGGWMLTGLSLLAAFPVLTHAQQPQADCPGSLQAYVGDRSLNARWGDSAHTYVIMARGGVEYICRCPSNTQPPVCTKKGSSGSGGLEGVDLSQFSPGQQMALMATQSLLNGLFSSIFKSPSKPSSPSAGDALRQQQELLRQQEEERQQSLAQWSAFQESEKARAQREKDEAKKRGEEILARTGGTGSQELTFQSVSGETLEFGSWVAADPEAQPLPSGKYPAPTKAVEQARCAAYFSERARELEKQGKHEQAAFMGLQAQKAMAGEPLDAPCQAAAAAAVPVPDSPAVKEVLEQYNVKIQELLDLSRKLSEVRKQKIDAELDIKLADDKITDIKTRAASVTKPEEKQELDDLLNEALALKSDSEGRLKIAAENENACLENAKKAEAQVQELGAKLQDGKDKK